MQISLSAYSNHMHCIWEILEFSSVLKRLYPTLYRGRPLADSF